MTKERFFQGQKWIGVFWKVTACIFYALLNIIVRYLSGGWAEGARGLDPSQISCVQNFVAYIVIIPMIWRQGLHSLKTDYKLLHGVRVFFGALGVLLLYYAFSVMPVSQAVALGFVGPIFTVILGWFYLKEPLGFFNTSGVILGIVGAYFISRPDKSFNLATIDLNVLLPLGSAMCFALTKILGRELALLKEPTHRIANYLMIFMAPLTLVPALAVWVHPTVMEWVLLLVLGGVSWAGHYCFAKSYHYAGVIFLMPFGFSRLLISALLAYGLFDELPKNVTFFWQGCLIIFISTLFICWEERYQRKTKGK